MQDWLYHGLHGIVKEYLIRNRHFPVQQSWETSRSTRFGLIVIEKKYKSKLFPLTAYTVEKLNCNKEYKNSKKLSMIYSNFYLIKLMRAMCKYFFFFLKTKYRRPLLLKQVVFLLITIFFRIMIYFSEQYLNNFLIINIRWNSLLSQWDLRPKIKV